MGERLDEHDEGLERLALTIGYTNASWTLKPDLVSEVMCRLLGHMDARRHDQCLPVNDDPGVTRQPLLDSSAGYALSLRYSALIGS